MSTMWRPKAAALPAMLPILAGAFSEVIEFDAYRAVPKADLRFTKLENADFADIPGLLDYLHTKVILEHPLELDTDKNKVETEERMSRVNSIDTIIKTRMKVKNPEDMLKSRQATHVEFGPAVQFVEGQATGAVYKWDFGDFVGVKKHSDHRFHTDMPYYWFSFSGFCPNLDRTEKYIGVNRTANEGCVQYKDGSGPLTGGFCPGGHAATALPTGKFGCVYTYEQPRFGAGSALSLDDVTGITQEDCGGRPCKDWLDFRNLCTNKQYKQKFQYAKHHKHGKTKLVPTPVCVEYDIDPECALDCNSHACKAIPEKDREVGLPFWRGRCDRNANRARFEAVAKAFGVKGATTEHNLVTPMKEPPSCQNQFHTTCQPFPEFGGMYCTRAWAGVCQECYIPGTVKANEKAASTPVCPWDVTENPEYATYKPICESGLPRHLCCIYAGSCNVTASEATTAPLNDDGYWLIASQKSTEVMEAYLTRAVQKLWHATIKDPEGVTQVAYREWGLAPIHGRSLNNAMHDLKPYIVIPPTTTTLPGTVTEPEVAAATTRKPAVSDRTEAPAVQAGTPVPSWIWFLLGGIALSCVFCGLLAFFLYSFMGEQEKKKSGDGRLGSTAKSGRGSMARASVAPQEERQGLITSGAPAVLTASGTPMVTSGQMQYIQQVMPMTTSGQQGYYVMAPQGGQGQIIYMAQPGATGP